MTINTPNPFEWTLVRPHPRKRSHLPSPSSHSRKSRAARALRVINLWPKSSPLALFAYCDGSFHPRTSLGGAAFIIDLPHPSPSIQHLWRRACPLGRIGSAQEAELEALLGVLECFLAMGSTRDMECHVATDCLSVINWVRNEGWNPRDGVRRRLVEGCRGVVRLLRKRNVVVVLNWLPGHCEKFGIPKGNQPRLHAEVDFLAGFARRHGVVMDDSRLVPYHTRRGNN